jgi:hypothetical protein
MTFFTEAQDDGYIDKKIEMSQQEFEMMLRGMLADSNVWEMHKNKHKDAHIAPIFRENASEFEQQVQKHSKKQEEQSIIQYDMHSKKFVAGCQCGAKFEIDVKNDKVEQADPSLKLKEMSNYDRGGNRQEQQYGGAQSEGNNTYNMEPKQMQRNPNYNSSGNPSYKS